MDFAPRNFLLQDLGYEDEEEFEDAPSPEIGAKRAIQRGWGCKASLSWGQSELVFDEGPMFGVSD